MPYPTGVSFHSAGSGVAPHWPPWAGNPFGPPPAMCFINLWFVLVGLALIAIVLWWMDRRHFYSGFCRKCHYDLTGNVSGICPECGRNLDRRERVASEQQASPDESGRTQKGWIKWAALVGIVLLAVVYSPTVWRHLKYRHLVALKQIDWPAGSVALAIRSCKGGSELMIRTGGVFSSTTRAKNPDQQPAMKKAEDYDYDYYLFEPTSHTIEPSDVAAWKSCDGLVEDRPYNADYPRDYQIDVGSHKRSEYYKRYVAEAPVGGTSVAYFFTNDWSLAAVISTKPQYSGGLMPFLSKRRTGSDAPQFLQFLSLKQKRWLTKPLVLPYVTRDSLGKPTPFQGLLWSRDNKFFVVAQHNSLCIVPLAQYLDKEP